MKSRVILATFVAIVLLAAAIGAGLNAVFTVTHVRAEFSTISSEGAAEAEEVRKDLDKFLGKSTTFVDLADVSAAVEKYPNFRVESIEKKYPATVRLSVVERRETFVFAREGGGYGVLDSEGKYLYDSEENVNRVSGKNILLEGFDLTEEGGAYVSEWLAVAGALSRGLDEIRSNIDSVTLVRSTAIARNDFFRIRMHEGVVIDICNPSYKPEEKAEAALNSYLALSDENRIYGFITVLDHSETGEILPPDYSRDSRLD